MTGDRAARAALTRIAETGDETMGRQIAAHGAEAVLAGIRAATLEGVDERKAAAWRMRALAAGDPDDDLARFRFVVPGDPDWPEQLDDLGDARPTGLWVDGKGDLRRACARSIALVGSRAASAYGVNVASELACRLSDRGYSVISGGAYGIDAAAHRGCLAGPSPTVAILACGVDVSYPAAHQDLFAAIREEGLVISESPPGVNPTRLRFLVRNRVIAALSRGTVVVQAAPRSGALNTAHHAFQLNRQLMAIPGPVTSDVSVGCNNLIRLGKAVCVTSADEILEQVGQAGDDIAPIPRGPVTRRDLLSLESKRILDAMPGGLGVIGPSEVALKAGLPLPVALGCLGSLEAGGYLKREGNGWRLTARGRGR
ncbi:DNA-processing protein DprA [Herbidospora cretacea]|uniref:DNA-processing protein DprA n=1 Tax=Herbidospora cretacea TaxID=28444 RepID=UPI000550AF1E|nr:DNA-processing protein DprA [Herbidospora cretacea]